MRLKFAMLAFRAVLFDRDPEEFLARLTDSELETVWTSANQLRHAAKTARDERRSARLEAVRQQLLPYADLRQLLSYADLRREDWELRA